MEAGGAERGKALEDSDIVLSVMSVIPFPLGVYREVPRRKAAVSRVLERLPTLKRAVEGSRVETAENVAYALPGQPEGERVAGNASAADEDSEGHRGHSWEPGGRDLSGQTGSRLKTMNKTQGVLRKSSKVERLEDHHLRKEGAILSGTPE